MDSLVGLQSIRLVRHNSREFRNIFSGSPLPKDTIDMINQPETCAVLLGSVGGPEWTGREVRPEQGK
jgi:isocitrate/isopropylmalate dehydrogenase